jgi:hypothetical protein
MLVSCLVYTSTLKMEATCSSETSVDFQQNTQCYILEDRTLHNHRCETLKSSPNQFSYMSHTCTHVRLHIQLKWSINYDHHVKTKYKFHAATIFYFTKSCIFFENPFTFRNSGHYSETLVSFPAQKFTQLLCQYCSW